MRRPGLKSTLTSPSEDQRVAAIDQQSAAAGERSGQLERYCPLSCRSAGFAVGHVDAAARRQAVVLHSQRAAEDGRPPLQVLFCVTMSAPLPITTSPKEEPNAVSEMTLFAWKSRFPFPCQCPNSRARGEITACNSARDVGRFHPSVAESDGEGAAAHYGYVSG